MFRVFDLGAPLSLSVMFLFLFPVNTLAGGGGSTTGDGGHGVVCEAGGVSTVELLDSYEARLIYGLPMPHFGSEIQQPTEIIMGYRAQVVERLGLDFFASVFDRAVATQVSLSPMVSVTPDDNPLGVLIPPHCHLEQLANRLRTGELVGLTVRSDLWRLLDNEQRALLLIHEALHDVFAERSQKGDIRFTVAFIMAPLDFQLSHAKEIRERFEKASSNSSER